MRLRHTTLMLAGLIAGGLLSAPAAAGIIEQDLPGTTQYDGWSDVSGSNPQVLAANNDGDPSTSYPSFPGNGPWPAPIESHTSGSGDAEFDKVSGTGYPAGFSVYTFGGGTFSVSDDTPVSSLETVVLQTEIGSPGIASDGPPTLSYNGGGQALSADISALIAQEAFSGGGFDITVNTRVFQWDLRGVTDPITEFGVEWSTASSATISGLRLDQSDTFGQASTAVPTPSAFALGLAGLGLAGVRRRRRRGVAL